MPDATPRPRRWRRWILLLVALLLCAHVVRFSYLRLTRRPTPRVAYWEARLAELDPPGPNALDAKEALRCSSHVPGKTSQAWRASLTRHTVRRACRNVCSKVRGMRIGRT